MRNYSDDPILDRYVTEVSLEDRNTLTIFVNPHVLIKFADEPEPIWITGPIDELQALMGQRDGVILEDRTQEAADRQAEITRKMVARMVAGMQS